MKQDKSGTRREPDRRYAARLAAAAGAVLLLACLCLWLMTSRPDITRESTRIGGPFSLVSDSGGNVTDQSFPGKYLAIYFGYTACRDVCPATLTTLAAALDRLGNKAAFVQPIFITLDPGRDTPQMLHQYVRAFSPRLIGLTGPVAALNAAEAEYHVSSYVNQEGANPASYTLDHGSVIYIIAPDGAFVAPVPASASEMTMAQAIARAIRPVS
jgi:protein SCO1/2